MTFNSDSLSSAPSHLATQKGYEAEIRRLSDGERRGILTAAEKEKLTSLRAEVERIKKTKDDYLEKHPEHRKFVYPNEEARLKAEKEKAEGKEANEGSSGGRGGPLYGKDGRLVSWLLSLVHSWTRHTIPFREANHQMM